MTTVGAHSHTAISVAARIAPLGFNDNVLSPLVDPGRIPDHRTFPPLLQDIIRQDRVQMSNAGR
jgi:hypothetical protein